MSGPPEPPTPAKVNVWPAKPVTPGRPQNPAARNPAARNSAARNPAEQYPMVRPPVVPEPWASAPLAPTRTVPARHYFAPANQIWIGIAVVSLLLLLLSFILWERPVSEHPIQVSSALMLWYR